MEIDSFTVARASANFNVSFTLRTDRSSSAAAWVTGTREGDDVGTGRLAEGADVGTGRLADTVDINWWYNISVFAFREGDAGDAVGTGGAAEDSAEGSRDSAKGPPALVRSPQRRRGIARVATVGTETDSFTVARASANIKVLFTLRTDRSSSSAAWVTGTRSNVSVFPFREGDDVGTGGLADTADTEAFL